MIKSTDLVLFAARNGILLTPSIAKEALQKVDREAIEADELKRWDTSTVWDGSGDTDPLGRPAHIWYGNDEHGPAHPTVKRNLDNGGHIVFIYKDGKLHSYQGHDPHHGGVALVDDPEHPHHHQKVAQRVVQQYLEQDVDARVLNEALEIALDLHEERGVPMGLTVPEGGRK